MRRVRSGTIIPTPGVPDRWSAALRLDHLQTDWTCGHHHLTRDAAQPCVDVLLDEVDSYLNSPTFQEQSVGIAGGALSGPVYAARSLEWRADGRVRRFQAGGIYTG